MRNIILIIVVVLITGIPPVSAARLSDKVSTSTAQTSVNPYLKTATKKNIRKPDKGMSMRKVERLFGTPVKKMPSTGTPPITRWIYQEFTVYFEGKYVIHAVKNRQFSPANANLTQP